MKKIDVIIILGGGTDGTLNPAFYTKERLEAFLSKAFKFTDIPIIVSGGYSASLDKVPKYTEAEVMENYLKQHGFSSKFIYLEKRSRDTIGNAYYSKQIIRRHPRWKNILVISTKAHIPRSRWIFNKIFGAKYNIQYLGFSSQHPSLNKNPARKKYETYLINLYKNMLSTVKDGDDESILKLLKTVHPAYSHTKKAKQRKREILQAKQKFLGYTKLPGVK